jgi:hypothetical protein
MHPSTVLVAVWVGACAVLSNDIKCYCGETGLETWTKWGIEKTWGDLCCTENMGTRNETQTTQCLLGTGEQRTLLRRLLPPTQRRHGSLRLAQA